MSIKDIFKSKLTEIEAKTVKNKVYGFMESLGTDIYDGLREWEILSKVECCPNEMNWGCICFHVRTLPEDVILKLCWDSDSYYAGFYQKYNDFFDQLIPRTINEQGVMVLKDIDEAEARILDFLANQYFGSKNKKLIN